ncbi:MAG: RpiB/LacA/LacB family sugar-phosphate isomerase [Marinifilaceae bacterium]|jgi:ribose 5-phosphate isomerase B|nr:RpiB/LacA/LacB family sugar-phosphate isomerase [Marinifilaceae bacterium]
MEKKICLAADHAGFEKKEMIKKYLQDKGFQIIDFGTNSEESMDYPDPVHDLAMDLKKNDYYRAFIFCGSGNGITMTANKHQHVRAALCWTDEISELARLHNNANVCGVPARFISDDLCIKIVDSFINTEFEGGRHERRVNKISIK